MRYRNLRLTLILTYREEELYGEGASSPTALYWSLTMDVLPTTLVIEVEQSVWCVSVCVSVCVREQNEL